tara:strand:+ start:1088 stop:1597 length:510 start_codon:yes stop_codon:yes gene_type:complete
MKSVTGQEILNVNELTVVGTVTAGEFEGNLLGSTSEQGALFIGAMFGASTAVGSGGYARKTTSTTVPGVSNVPGLLVSITLNKGTYLVGYAAQADGGSASNLRHYYLGVGGTFVGANSVNAADTGYYTASGQSCIQITADATDVQLYGYVEDATVLTNPSQELWAQRTA